MNSAAVKTDWFSAIRRQEAKVAQAWKRVREATSAADREEYELAELRRKRDEAARGAVL